MVGKYEGEILGVTKAGVQFEMKNVVYLPNLRGNLLSVKKLSESGIELLFTKHNGQDKAILKHDGETIAEANLRGNLYELELVADPVTPTFNLCAAEVRPIWHCRLGHASQQAMNNLVKHGINNQYATDNSPVTPVTSFFNDPNLPVHHF